MRSRKTFLTEYGNELYLRKAEAAGISWNRIKDIYDDYKNNYYEYYNFISTKIVEKLYMKAPNEVNIIYGRAKNPDHLVEKIIRKIGKDDKAIYKSISVSNYRDIITDLVGIRILTLKKEDWDVVDAHIHKRFKTYNEDPVAYVCYGDRDIYDDTRIRVDYTNRGYRSQHYVIRYKGIPCEIQVRTLAEEVYGEFDHRVRYPYHVDNKFLGRYSRIISKIVSELDDLISTGSALSRDKDIVEDLGEIFVEDKYVDWQKKIEDSKDLSNGKKEKPQYHMRASMGAKEFSHDYLTNRRN